MIGSSLLFIIKKERGPEKKGSALLKAGAGARLQEWQSRSQGEEEISRRQLLLELYELASKRGFRAKSKSEVSEKSEILPLDLLAKNPNCALLILALVFALAALNTLV